MITCRELIDFLHDYVENALPSDQRLIFERHLGICPECVAYLRNYEATVHLGRSACQDQAGGAPPIPEGLVQAILAARSKCAG
jgi:anti-sigma factor RsiW